MEVKTMEMNKKLLLGIVGMLVLGITLVSASSYMSMNALHKKMLASNDFEAMHDAMMRGDFAAAEKYHATLDFECLMHELVKNGDISLEEFRTMHEWMLTGDFPRTKPAGISDAAWELHTSHHPALYK
ncbi:hypothetical protein D6789_02795 [Candidatus Woesearchaeota archaeon]|nr:MAG: hypothetical protein D6789_02795 [Candidatus Woesearchaeota archaeon]